MDGKTDQLPGASEITSDVVASIADPIGFLMLNWAHIDQALSAISMATKPIALKHGLFEKHYRQFSKKLKHVRLLFEKIPELQPHRDATLKALRFVAAAQIVRDAVVHGILHQYDPERGMFVFLKVNPLNKDQSHGGETVSFTLEVLNRQTAF
jgi:hypothetical protein